MNKKILMPIALLILVSLAILVSAFAGEIYFDFDEGWNLIYGFISPEQLNDQVLEKQNIKAIYAFVPTTQEYVRLFPNSEMDLEDLEDKGIIDDDEMLQTAFWVYTKKGAISEYWLYAEPNPFNERPIYQGWNFIGITPDMISQSPLRDIKGDCNIQKSYVFINEFQRWEAYPLTNKFDNNNFVGFGWVIKVSDDCRLGSSTGDGISPPTLPGGNGENTGLRKEIENYYYEEIAYESCDLNQAKDYNSKESCELAVRCIAKVFAGLVLEEDLQDLVNYMAEHGGESGAMYYLNKNPDIEDLLEPKYATLCLSGRHKDY